MPFNTRTGGQQDIAQQGYTELRVLKGERRGKIFHSPISYFVVTTGAANTGPQVALNIALTKLAGVQAIQILRNQSRDPGSASVLVTYPMTPLSNVKKVITYHDSDPATFGKTYFYFVRVVPLHSNFQPILQGPIQVAVP